MTHRPSSPRILCVDDEPYILEALERTLSERADVVTATSGASGLDILRSQGPFEVVISDMQMPHMDGAAFLAQARLLAPDTVRILLTGHVSIDAAIAAVNEGDIFRFLTKPCAPGTLWMALEAGLKQYELITERKRVEVALRASETRYRLLVENSSQGLCIYRDGVIQFVNSTLANILGYASPDPIIGQAIQHLASSRHGGALADDAGSGGNRDSGQSPYEVQMSRQDGGTVWLECRESATAWDDTPAWVITVIDISHRKAEELAETNARLEFLNRLKTDFLSFISHELRTPLNAMVAIDLLDPHGDPQEQAEMIGLVRLGYERLEQLIMKGLDYFNWVAVNESQTSAVTDLDRGIQGLGRHDASLGAPGSAVSIATPGAPCWVRGDEKHLLNVAQILLDNARKFSSPDTEIEVCVKGTAQSVTLSVSDCGQGFQPEWAAELFHPFTSADVTHHTQGTGLNLALARAIVEAYGGELTAASAGVGQGATFSAVFPAIAAQEIDSAAPACDSKPV